MLHPYPTRQQSKQFHRLYERHVRSLVAAAPSASLAPSASSASSALVVSVHPVGRTVKGVVCDVRTFYDTSLILSENFKSVNAQLIREPKLYPMGEGVPKSAMMCVTSGGDDVSHPNFTTDGVMVTPKEDTRFTTHPVYLEDGEYKLIKPKYCERPLLEEYHTCPLHERLEIPESLSATERALVVAVTRARAWTMIWDAKWKGGAQDKKFMDPKMWSWRETTWDSPHIKALLQRAGAHYPLDPGALKVVSQIACQATMLEKQMNEERNTAWSILYMERMRAYEDACCKHCASMRSKREWSWFYEKYKHGNLEVYIVPHKWPMLKEGETTLAHQLMFGCTGQPKREDFSGPYASAKYKVALALTKARLWDAVRKNGSVWGRWWEKIVYEADTTTQMVLRNDPDSDIMTEMQLIAVKTSIHYDEDIPTLHRNHNKIISVENWSPKKRKQKRKRNHNKIHPVETKKPKARKKCK